MVEDLGEEPEETIYDADKNGWAKKWFARKPYQQLLTYKHTTTTSRMAPRN